MYNVQSMYCKPSVEAYRYLLYMYVLFVQLLGNITEWAGLIAPDALQELVLNGLLNRYPLSLCSGYLSSVCVCACHRYLVLALQTCLPSSLSVTKTQAVSGGGREEGGRSEEKREREGEREVRNTSSIHQNIVKCLVQIISRLPSAWMSDGSTVTRPLQGVVLYLSQLSGHLHRATLGNPDHLRQKTR